ncbi:thioredoxin domain-containing protein [Bifidobacterium sp. ESL0775]|uniref:DsbA family protein n=1 Tax=Bifidobacterium sp. ESL0775 TaxID=2983230 RepID=UPI0023F8397A|nr:thioredoxin domain-containing protein [Bifidobacterium sp. ESL0775]WEV69359.1 thioredoxin domain-containing protein [Bifidobacterium sp. ESL0775]
MAQQGTSKSQKRKARAKRQAEQEALERAQAEEAAKERKQQTIIGGIVVAVIVVLVAVIAIVTLHSVHKKAQVQKVSNSTSYSALQKVKVKPTVVDDKGGILISKDGYGKKLDKAPTVEIYMDPLCPGCGSLHRQIDGDLDKLVDAGQINLVYHPMNFLDQDSTDQYSTRAAGAILYVASHDANAEHLMGFVSNLYNKDYQPEEGPDYKATGNDKIKEQALKASVAEDVIDKAFDGRYNKWLTASYNYTITRKELQNQSGQNKGSMSTPAVTINGTLIDQSEISQLNIPQEQALLKSLGLKDSQVGERGVMPKIGGTGAPQSLQ